MDAASSVHHEVLVKHESFSVAVAFRPYGEYNHNLAPALCGILVISLPAVYIVLLIPSVSYRCYAAFL